MKFIFSRNPRIRGAFADASSALNLGGLGPYWGFENRESAITGFTTTFSTLIFSVR